MLRIPFLRTSKPPRHFLVLDLGADSVKAFVFEVEEKEKGPVDFLKAGQKRLSVIGVGRASQEASAMYSGAAVDTDAVSEGASQAVAEAVLSCGVSPKRLLLGLSGEAVKSFTTTLKLHRENQKKPLGRKELRFIADKVKEAAFREVGREMAEITSNPDLKLETVFSALLEVKVDGYRVSRPLGLGGKTLEFSFFSAVSPAIHLAAFEKILGNLKIKSCQTVPLLYSLVRLLVGRGRGEMNFILFDVGGQSTDLALVFGGKILGCRTVNIGGAAATSALADSLNLDFAEAEKKKIGYGEGKLDEAESEKVKNILQPVFNLWCRAVETALADFSQVKSFPERIVFAGGAAAMPDLQASFAGFPWTRSLPFTASPKVRLLGTEVLAEFLVDKTGKALRPANILPLSLGDIFLELEEKNDETFFRT